METINNTEEKTYKVLVKCLDDIKSKPKMYFEGLSSLLFDFSSSKYCCDFTSIYSFEYLSKTLLKRIEEQYKQSDASEYGFEPDFTTDCTPNPNFRPHIWTVDEIRQAIADEMRKIKQKKWLERMNYPIYYIDDIGSVKILQEEVDENVETYFDAVSVATSDDIPDFIRYNNRKYLVWKPTFLGTLSSGSQAASQHHCRSFLLASCQQKSDDDLLGD